MRETPIILCVSQARGHVAQHLNRAYTAQGILLSNGVSRTANISRSTGGVKRLASHLARWNIGWRLLIEED